MSCSLQPTSILIFFYIVMLYLKKKTALIFYGYQVVVKHNFKLNYLQSPQ